MNKSLVVPLIVALAWGCQATDKGTIYAAREAWNVIGKEYRSYVSNDPKLDDSSKGTRIRTADMLTTLLEDTKK